MSYEWFGESARNVRSALLGVLLCWTLVFLGVGAVASPEATLALPGDLPDSAFAEGAFDGDEARLGAHLLVDPTDPHQVGVLFEVDPGWHLYWKNPGDSGLATEIQFATQDREVGGSGLVWPTPYAFSESFEDGESLTTYGYGDQVLLTTRLAHPLERGETLRAEITALVCDTQCIPASVSLARPVPSPEDRSKKARERAALLFAAFAERVPVTPSAVGASIEPLWSQSALRPGDVLEAAWVLHSCQEPEACTPLRLAGGAHGFFPDESEALRFHELGIRTFSGREALAFQVEAGDRLSKRVRGVLVTVDPEGRRRGLRLDLPLAAAPTGAAVDVRPLPTSTDAAAAIPLASQPADTGTERGLSLFGVLWLAFVGGLILNLMPCVLPVLAIKVFSVADLAHRSRREVLAHGLAYSAGILVTMTALAAGVIALRGAGHSVGWGFQFQEPLFVAFVCTVVVVFALNLLGVFEIRFDPGKLAEVGAEAVGPRRSFFEGLLAVVLATPCSAPFLGTAVGFAFSSSAAEIVAVFCAIGAGLAAPYALVTAIPAWSHIIPKPGTWMLKLRCALGFLLLGSAVWLVWVFGRSAGLDAVSGLLAFLVFAAFLCWLYGNLPVERPVWMPAGIGLALVAVALLGANAVSIEPSEGGTGRDADWATPYEPAAIDRELAAGRSVFAYFTADWCITCKVNERRVLARSEVRDELERLDIAVFRGDWTHRDDAIRAELERYGKAGVPVYVVRHPNAPEAPIVLPELLTAERLFHALATPRATDL